VQNGYFADDLTFLKKVDGRLPTIVSGQVNTNDPFRYKVETVGLLTLLKKHLAGRKRCLARYGRKALQFSLIKATKDHAATKPYNDIGCRHPGSLLQHCCYHHFAPMASTAVMMPPSPYQNEDDGRH